MTKKVILFLFIFCFLGSNCLWADETLAITIACIGASFITAAYLLDDGEPDSDTSISLMYAGGGILLAGGLIWFFVALFTSDSYANISDGTIRAVNNEIDNESEEQRKVNPILEHLRFGIMPDKVFVGASFKY